MTEVVLHLPAHTPMVRQMADFTSSRAFRVSGAKGGISVRMSTDSAGPARPTNSVDSRRCIIRQRPGDSHVTRSVGAFVLSDSEYRTRYRAGRCGRFPQDLRS